VVEANAYAEEALAALLALFFRRDGGVEAAWGSPETAGDDVDELMLCEHPRSRMRRRRHATAGGGVGEA
jgi:hypothetical protein